MHQHAIRPLAFEYRIELGKDAGAQGIQGLVGNHHIKIVMRLDIEQVHHLFQHGSVLPGDTNHRVYAGSLLHGAYQRSHLDGFRTGTENGKYFHAPVALSKKVVNCQQHRQLIDWFLRFAALEAGVLLLSLAKKTAREPKY